MRRLERLNAIIDILASYGLIKEATNTDLSDYYKIAIPSIDSGVVSPLTKYLSGNLAQRITAAAALRLAGIDTSTFPQEFINESRALIQKHPKIASGGTIPPKAIDEFMDLAIKYSELRPLAARLGEHMLTRLDLPVPSYNEFPRVYGQLASYVRLPKPDATIAASLLASIQDSKQVNPGIWYHLVRLYLRAAANQGKLQEVIKIINARR